MSQYLIIKQRINGRFYPTVSFSRNTLMYEIFNDYVAYAKGEPLTRNLLDCAHKELQLTEKHISDRVKSIGKQIERVSSFNNSVDEKFELVNELTAETHDLGEQLIDVEHARAQLNMLGAMMDEATYSDGAEYYIGIEWDTETTD